MPTLGTTRTTLQQVVDTVRTQPDLQPLVPAGGFSTQLATSIANDVMQRFLAEGLDWKWNRGYVPPILTAALQQDYCTSITDISWLEQGWCIDINNSTNNGNRAPKPVFSLETVRDLGQTSYQGKPFNCSYIQNSLAFLGLWEANTAYGCAYGQPMTPITPVQQFMDVNGNILYIDSTVLGLNSNSPGFTNTPIPLPPGAPYGTSGNVQPELPADTPPGTTVQDGTVVWTVADPNAFAIRVAPLPALSGLAWLLYPVYQKLPPYFTSLSQTLDPIPENLIYLFRQGFRAMALQHANSKMFNAAYAQWEEDLIKALQSGDREGSDGFFYPSEGIMGGVGTRFGAAYRAWLAIHILSLRITMATQQFYSPNSLATSLNAVTAGSTAGTSFAMPQYGYSRCPPTKFTWQMTYTGSPSGVSASLQGSIDGVNFFTLDTSTNTSGELRSVVNMPMKFIQIYLTTLTGGTAPAATGQFVVAE